MTATSQTKSTNGSYRQFPDRLRDSAEAPGVMGLQWGGHYVSNQLKDAASEIDRLRAIIRVNALRGGASHELIDCVLFHHSDKPLPATAA